MVDSVGVPPTRRRDDNESRVPSLGTIHSILPQLHFFSQNNSEKKSDDSRNIIITELTEQESIYFVK